MDAVRQAIDTNAELASNVTLLVDQVYGATQEQGRGMAQIAKPLAQTQEVTQRRAAKRGGMRRSK